LGSRRRVSDPNHIRVFLLAERNAYGDSRYPKMPSWVLKCSTCGKNFTHSTIRKAALVDFYFEAKPEFPLDGSELECSNCGNKATYQRTDLMYQA
jgi:DNA-directed RNA polymerase subunit RPC12/RpoP